MGEQVDYRLLGKYLFGECSEEEEAQVHAWIEEDVARAELVAELRKVWETTGGRLPASDVEAAWRRLAGRLEPEPASERRRTSRSPRRRVHSWSRRYPSRVAAVVLVAVVAVVLVVLVFESPDLGVPTSEQKAFLTKRGQQATIRLTDGTRVRLNAESKLVLAAGFSEGQRAVRLVGEAYFEVARDTTRPFVVHTRGATVKVLGTRFDVQAYPGEAVMHVAVTEGKVAVKPAPNVSRDTSVVLRPRNVAVVAGSEGITVHEDVDLSPYVAWTKGRLVFEDAPFDEVARTLERWYDLQVEVRAAPEVLGRLNATFDDESLQEVLTATAAALGLQYEKVGRTVTFFRTSRRSPSAPRVTR